MTYRKLINTKWIILLVLFGLFTPGYLSQFEIIDTLADGIRLAAYIFILLICLKNVRKLLNKTFNISVLILWAELLLSTILSKVASPYNYFTSMAMAVLSCFFIEILATYCPVNGVHCLYWYFSACVLINTATVFLFPNAMYANNRGLWRCWFLGEDNAGYIFYIVASTVAMIYTKYISKRITILSSLVWASSFIFVFHNDIATGIACQIIWAILVFGYQFGWFRKLLKARYILYATVGGFVAVILLRGFIFEPIVSALGRNITLTGRTLLWDHVLEIMQERPLLGFGICTGEEFNGLLNTDILSAHNWLLMLMFYGGIVAVVLFSLTVMCACRDAKSGRNSSFYRCMVIGLIVLGVRFLVEAGHLQIMFVMLAILAYSKEFTQGLENVQTKKRFAIKGIPKIRLLRRNHI